MLGAAASFSTLYFMKQQQTNFASRMFMTYAWAEESFKEIEIAFSEEIKEGEMRELVVGDGEEDKVLVAKYKGKLRCIGNYCSHFNLPLAKSVMADDKVICPFHNAAFSILTGEPENAPAFDGLPVFEVVEKEGKIYAKVPYPLPKKKPMHMAKPDGSDKWRFVIIGGGAAGQSAAETLRQSDFKGEIVILSKEDRIAYDRTLLSKNTSGVDTTKAVLRPQAFLTEYGINYKLNSTVKSIDAAHK